MSDTIQGALYLPNQLGRTILLALEEIVGREGFTQTLSRANLPHLAGDYPPDDLERQFDVSALSGILSALEEDYGRRCGRGLALRAGRAWFKYGMRAFNPLSRYPETDFRFLSRPARLRRGLALFARLFNELAGQGVLLEERPDRLYWRLQFCPECWKRRAEGPVCHLTVGFLEEALYWLSGGKTFLVEEVRCLAQGDPDCTFAIGAHPLE